MSVLTHHASLRITEADLAAHPSCTEGCGELYRKPPSLHSINGHFRAVLGRPPYSADMKDDMNETRFPGNTAVLMVMFYVQ